MKNKRETTSHGVSVSSASSTGVLKNSGKKERTEEITDEIHCSRNRTVPE
jgi:hypothetical protein